MRNTASYTKSWGLSGFTWLRTQVRSKPWPSIGDWYIRLDWLRQYHAFWSFERRRFQTITQKGLLCQVKVLATKHRPGVRQLLLLESLPHFQILYSDVLGFQTMTRHMKCSVTRQMTFNALLVLYFKLWKRIAGCYLKLNKHTTVLAKQSKPWPGIGGCFVR